MSKENSNAIDLRRLFRGLQDQMNAKLSSNQESIPHSGAKGTATELNWTKMLDSYLPERYRVAKAFVIDSTGNLSEQIDIVIFDRQYSPFLFNQDNIFYVPAESVYAVFEVKQELSKQTIKYAGQKAASVRSLNRTSAPVPYVEGVYEPKKLFEIVAGILTSRSSWDPPLGSSFETAITELGAVERLNLGCALQSGSFKISYDDKSKPVIEKSDKDDALIFFFLNLVFFLQQLGTVPALNINEYLKSLQK